MNCQTYLKHCAVALMLLGTIISKCSADSLERAAIAACHDQLQNVVLDCEETRTYNIDPAVAADAPLHFRQPQPDLNRTESSALKFSFLDGNARFERSLSKDTLNYWASKGLPAIVRQIQTISATGRIEELTTQELTNGKRPSFGGFRQLAAFAPDVTIDIALGLRLLGARQWLSDDDLSAMQEVAQRDPSLTILQVKDGSGRVHELHFDSRLLYALVYYRCTNSVGGFVEITNTDFQRIGNTFIPGTIVRSSSVTDSTGQIRHPIVFTISMKKASVNDEKNTLDQYSIWWPAHLELFDARTNDRIKVGPTTRPFTDADIRTQVAATRAQNRSMDQMAAERIRQALESQPSDGH